MTKRTLFFALCIGIVAPVASAAAPAAEEEGWTKLFNGKTLEGWHNPYEWGKAWVADKEIRLQADKKFFLVTDKKYRDFVFEGEILMPKGKANSGFMFRCNEKPNKVFGYQAEVDPSDRQWSGGLYDEGRRGWLNPDRENEASVKEFRKKTDGAYKAGEWNRYRIQCVGDHLQIWLNGVQTTDYKDSTDREGYLAIQHHGEKGQIYRFRNLRIKELNEKGEPKA